jgi:ankyrin repeat protein
MAENEAFVAMDSVDENTSQPSTPLNKKRWSVKVKEASMELNELAKTSRYNYYEDTKDSLIHLAVQSGNHYFLDKEITKAKERGIDSLDSLGFAALHHTARHNRIDAVTVLLKNGADVNVLTRDDSNTPLHIASR